MLTVRVHNQDAPALSHASQNVGVHRASLIPKLVMATALLVPTGCMSSQHAVRPIGSVPKGDTFTGLHTRSSESVAQIAERSALAAERESAMRVANRIKLDNYVYLASNGEAASSFNRVHRGEATGDVGNLRWTVQHGEFTISFSMRDFERWKSAQVRLLMERNLKGVLFDIDGSVVDPARPQVLHRPVERFKYSPQTSDQ